MISFPPFYVRGRRLSPFTSRVSLSAGKGRMMWRLHSAFYKRNETARAMDSETRTSGGVVVNADRSHPSLHEQPMLFMS